MTAHRTLSSADGVSGLCRRLALVVILLGLAAAPAAAQVRPKPGPAKPHAALSRQGDAGQPVALTLTKARQFVLPVDVRDVLVADPTVADVLIKTPRLVYMIGSKVGDTNAIFLDAKGAQVLKLDIRVDRDLTALRKAIRDLVPSADVKVSPLNQDLVISGDVPSAQIADQVRMLVRHFVDKDENLVNMMRVTGAQQVLIRVKVAEVRRTVTKKLGFDLFLQGDAFSFQSGALSGLGMFPDRFGTGSSVGTAYPGTTKLDQSITGSHTGTRTLSTASGASGLPSLTGTSQVASSIEALEQQGLFKTLAEPNLTAVSGEPASFLAGGEFPIPTAKDAQGNIIITFKPFGVSLAFTPVVLATGRISLRISTEVSELSSENQIQLTGTVIPALNVRRAQTTVEMPSGGSLVLGGLLQNNARNTVQGLPGLKDLPVLGALFRSTNFLTNESELVVIATPYVVRAALPEAMTAPTDGFAPASDIDMYLLNGLFARYGAGSKAKPAAPAAADKPFGYIMP